MIVVPRQLITLPRGDRVASHIVTLPHFPEDSSLELLLRSVAP
jgi:hypothetical protein